MWVWFHKFGSPPHFYRIAGRLIPWFAIPAALLLLGGTLGGLWLAPPDYQQLDGFRIIYVHVPASYMGMFVYVMMALAAAVGLVWRMKMAFIVAAACAPLGAAFTFLSLATGSIWGKPMWGVWWVWDGRLTSMLVLFFLYLGVMGLRSAFEEPNKGDRAAGLLSIVGVINIPIIKFSVDWWHTLHQPATISTLERMADPAIDTAMLIPLLMMVVGYMLFFAAVLSVWVRGEVLRRERGARWTRELFTPAKAH